MAPWQVAGNLCTPTPKDLAWVADIIAKKTQVSRSKPPAI